MYRRADKAMVSRVLGKGLLKTKVLLDEHLIFKHNMEICKFKENPGNHAPPTDSDCATRFAIVNKRSAHIYTHTNPDQSKKRRVVATDENEGDSEEEEDAGASKNDAKRDPNFRKDVAHRDRKCVVTGITNRYGGMGTSADNLWVGPGMEGAHIRGAHTAFIFVSTFLRLRPVSAANDLQTSINSQLEFRISNSKTPV
jgi:hypothetical protein